MTMIRWMFSYLMLLTLGCAGGMEKDNLEGLSESQDSWLQQGAEKAGVYPAGSPVATYGKLKVENRQLSSYNGDPVQLKGMSTHGLQWYGGFVNKEAFQTLASGWKASVVRAAMYTAEGGYISDPSVKTKVEQVVQYAEETGMYALIDWHILLDNDPNTYLNQSKIFFEEMAKKYALKSHVLYELCNEPNGNVHWADIKRYALQVIPLIRKHDPKAVIIVGTGTWSQDVQEPAADPIPFDNILYAVHFYAGTHTQSLRDRVSTALGSIAIFATEWGTSSASGDGGPFLTEAQKWIDFLATKKVSWCNWSLADKSEVSAALLPGASPSGSWPDSQLSASGLFVKKAIQESGGSNPNPTNPTNPTNPDNPTVPSNPSNPSNPGQTGQIGSVQGCATSGHTSAVSGWLLVGLGALLLLRHRRRSADRPGSAGN